MTDDTQHTLDSARLAAEHDELDGWVHGFLCSPGSDNAELAEILHGKVTTWIGPVRLPLDRLVRLAGPPDAPVLCPVDEDFWDDRVSDMEERIEDGWEPPPLLVTFAGDHLYVEDGNHRAESLRQAGRRSAWALIGFESDDDRVAFEAAMSARVGPAPPAA